MEDVLLTHEEKTKEKNINKDNVDWIDLEDINEHKENIRRNKKTQEDEEMPQNEKAKEMNE